MAKGLTKRFGDFTAVDGISFSVEPGETFGVLGPNGAGKSSTMKMVSTVSPRTDGTLQIFGLDPERDGRQIRTRLGVVPQEDILDVDLTARENLMIYQRYFGVPWKQTRAKADQLLEFMQLGDRGGDSAPVAPSPGSAAGEGLVSGAAGDEQAGGTPSPAASEDGALAPEPPNGRMSGPRSGESGSVASAHRFRQSI